MSGYVDFAGVYDRLTSEIDYQKRGRYFDACIQRHGGKKGILLDLGCGTGSMCEVMASLVVTSIPIFVVYVAAQKYIVQGFGSAGLKM